MSASLDAPAAPLRAAMVRFPTLEPARWPALCSALAGLGFTAVDVPLVWREHQRGDGSFDFEQGPLELSAMVGASKSAGLEWVVRLGAIVTDEAVGLGLPDDVLFDPACQARTRRGNPLLVPDPPRLVPLPSLYSRRYKERSTRWLEAASAAVARTAELFGAPARIILGDGPQALARDAVLDLDHHRDRARPGAAPEHGASAELAQPWIAQDTRTRVEARHAAAALARAAGLDASRFAFALTGAANMSPSARALAPEARLVLASPPPFSGAANLWRLLRQTVALGAAHGVHMDFWSGGPAWYPPSRGSHTVGAATLALASGVTDFTVRMGAAGHRWVGALLANDGSLRPHAPQWQHLLQLARELPTQATELGALLHEPEELLLEALVSSAVQPLPAGLLGLLGLTPSALLPQPDEHTLLPRDEERRRLFERELQKRAIPVRRTPWLADTRWTPAEEESPEDFAARLAPEVPIPVVEPPGAVLLRLCEDTQGTHLIAVSQHHLPARVHPPEEGAWSGGPVELQPGAFAHFVKPREEPATNATPDEAPASADTQEEHTELAAPQTPVALEAPPASSPDAPPAPREQAPAAPRSTSKKAKKSSRGGKRKR